MYWAILAVGMIMPRLDRLGRSTRDVLNFVHELDEKGASFDAVSTIAGQGTIALEWEVNVS